MIRDFAKAVCSRLQEQINDYVDDVARGACQEFEDYKHLCGQIRGLRLAQECINDLAKKVETDDGDFDDD